MSTKIGLASEKQRQTFTFPPPSPSSTSVLHCRHNYSDPEVQEGLAWGEGSTVSCSGSVLETVGTNWVQHVAAPGVFSQVSYLQVLPAVNTLTPAPNTLTDFYLTQYFILYYFTFFFRKFFVIVATMSSTRK